MFNTFFKFLYYIAFCILFLCSILYTWFRSVFSSIILLFLFSRGLPWNIIFLSLLFSLSVFLSFPLSFSLFFSLFLSLFLSSLSLSLFFSLIFLHIPLFFFVYFHLLFSILRLFSTHSLSKIRGFNTFLSSTLSYILLLCETKLPI